ncbi:MAG TPA: TIGR04076 family protein [Longilinea sp.]|nr:TIGR04076 family protein [Longilinea sp.]
MAQSKITVIERSFRKEYVDLIVENERKKTLGPCEVFTEGQTFIVDAAASMPQGFCPWAWNDIYKVIVAFYANGKFDMWTQGGDVIIACCTDGTRPVYFKIEKIKE